MSTCIMPVVNVEPDNSHKVPYNTDDESPRTLRDEMVVAANTVELQTALGAELNLTEGDTAHEEELIKAVANAKKNKKTEITKPNTAFAAAAFLRTYGQHLALNAAEARAAITNKLMEIANCGDPRFELKALELLGKHSDIGMFTERSEMTIKYETPEALEKEIRDRVKRLLNADVIDITPLGADLDEELGVVALEPDLLDGIGGDDGELDMTDPDLAQVDDDEDDDDLDL